MAYCSTHRPNFGEYLTLVIVGAHLMSSCHYREKTCLGNCNMCDGKKMGRKLYNKNCSSRGFHTSFSSDIQYVGLYCVSVLYSSSAPIVDKRKLTCYRR